MTIKNFKVGQGLDLDGLILTNNSGELYVNGNAIAVDLSSYATQAYVSNNFVSSNTLASSGYVTSSEVANTLASYVTSSYLANTLGNYSTTAYVDNAIANSAVDLSQSAGTGLSYNVGTDKLDVKLWSLPAVPTGYAAISDVANFGLLVDITGLATEGYVDTAVASLANSAPAALDTLNELAAALGDDASFAANLVNTLSTKQDVLTAGNNIVISGNTISADIPAAYISSVDASFAVTNGELSLSDTITISSVELTDSVGNVIAASDVFGDANYSYSGGSNVTVGTLPTGSEVADVFITLKMAVGASIFSRTSKLTYVNSGSDAPTWTEYGIIVSGSFPSTTISFDSSGNIIANVTGSDPYSAKGVVTVLK